MGRRPTVIDMFWTWQKNIIDKIPIIVYLYLFTVTFLAIFSKYRSKIIIKVINIIIPIRPKLDA